jgi:nifR3 family TIM-barrel protein
MPKPLVIGSLALENNLLLAPMAGVTNLAMRLIARSCGASLCFTEMVSVEGLVREGRKTFDLLKSTPEDRPLGIQIFGDNPDAIATATSMVEPYGDLIDINMGCPVKKVVNSGSGSMLLRDPVKVAAIIRAARRATRLPLTIKIRTGWTCSEQTFHEIASVAEDEGCDAITLPPRSRAQMFEGKASWDRIAELKQRLRIPVLGSGDLFFAADAVRMLDETGCDGLMFARGAMGNPWIFRETLRLLAGEAAAAPTPDERCATALQHLALFVEHEGERVAIREMRKHLAWYAKGVPGAAAFRSKVNTLDNRDAMETAIRQFFTGENHDKPE